MPLVGKKIKQSRIFQEVADQIQKSITDGNLKPGDVLPSELKLTQMFATSRGTIREALRVLEQKGLIKIKVGSSGGAIVKTVDTGIMVEVLDLLVQSKKISVNHLTEFREVVEGSVAALAAERSTPKDIKRLRGLLTKYGHMVKDGRASWKDFVRQDVSLHIAIAEIIRNPLFIAVLQMIHQNILGSYEQFSLTDESFLKENYLDLCNIVEAIEQGRAKDAGFLSQYHVKKFSEYMKKKMGAGEKPMKAFQFNPASRTEKIVYGAERPGFPKESVYRGVVEDWIRFMQEQGIRRICCLLTENQLDYYREDLLGSYRREFGNNNLCWAPVEDYSLCDVATLTGKILPFLTESDTRREKVVVHCSGGIGRTGHILAAWLHYGRGYDIEQALLEVKRVDRDPSEAVESGHITMEQLHALLRQCGQSG